MVFCSIQQFQYMSKTIIALLVLLAAVNCLPSTFDIRYQPKVSIYGNFQPSPDYFCQSYYWAKQLSQIISSKLSIEREKKMILSAQQLAQCVPTQTDNCKQATLKDIEDAIKYIQSQGLVEQDCYRNRLLQLPRKFCSRKCQDGRPFVRSFKALITQETDTQKLLTAIGNGQSFGFVIYKYYEDMNYYSPDQTGHMKDGGDLYSYGVAEIVGWKKAGEELTLRMGASGWGFKGYAFVPKNSRIIVKYYSVNLLGYQDLQADQ